MGAETEILARAGGQTFNLMMHGRASHAPGERVFAADAAHAHLFDAATGRRL